MKTQSERPRIILSVIFTITLLPEESHDIKPRFPEENNLTISSGGDDTKTDEDDLSGEGISTAADPHMFCFSLLNLSASHTWLIGATSVRSGDSESVDPLCPSVRSVN